MLYYVNCDDDMRVRMVANCFASEVPGMRLITGEKLVMDLTRAIINKEPDRLPKVERGLLVMDLDYVLRGRSVTIAGVIEDIFIPLLREGKTIWLYGRDHRDIISHPAFDPVRDLLEEYDLMANII